MLTLILVIAIVLIIVCFFLYVEDVFCVDFLWCALGWILGIGSVILLIVIFCLIGDVATAPNIDNEIAQYEEKNMVVELEIQKMVSNHFKLYSDKASEVNINSDAISLASVIPELNSNTYVQEQLNLYRENEKEITKLRDKKNLIPRYKWFLYFGK